MTWTTQKALNKEVTAAAILGVTPPVANATPSTGISNGTGFTSSLLWNSSTFGYAATITLTAKGGFTFTGVIDDASIAGFTVNGITPAWVSNSSTELKFTVTFPATAYSITVGSSTGGSVSTNKTSAAAGKTVTLAVYPASGYELSAISVFKTGDASVTISVNGFNCLNALNGNFSFTMPAYAITVYASFSEILPPEPAPDAGALDAMIHSIRNLHVTVPQEEGNTEADAVIWLKAYLARLFLDKGWDITVQKLTVVNFFPATVGTRTDVPGTNGSFSFFAPLRHPHGQRECGSRHKCLLQRLYIIYM